MAFTTLNGATLTSLDKLLKEWYLNPIGSGVSTYRA